MGLLGALTDRQFWNDVGGNVADLGQSASNSVASNVTAPVDGLAWLLRKAGVPVPDAPMGGSDWAKNAGLLRDVAQSPASLAGDSLGMIAPMLLAAKAPQIARGLLQMGENAAIPKTLNKQAGMILYHGSNDSKPIKEIRKDGVFGGLFASPSERSASSHGDALYRMTIPDNQIMGMGDELPWDGVKSVVEKNTRSGNQYIDDIAEMVSEGRSAYKSSIPEDDLLSALRASEIGEADWEIQRLRGLAAKEHGYKAAAMPDEHGTSYLVFPGTSARPANDAAKNLFRNRTE